MAKRKKVLLPRWMLWFLVSLMLLVEALIVYAEFFSDEAGELGTVGFIIVSVLILGQLPFFWLMTTGKLPAYIIEDDE